VPSSEHQGVLWFDVDAGPLFEIIVRGNEAKDREELMGLIDLKERLIITDGTWRELGRRMTTAYEEAGYVRAHVDVKVQDSAEGEEAAKQVVFEISEGRSYKIESVTFEGNRRISAERLLDQMETRPRTSFSGTGCPLCAPGRC